MTRLLNTANGARCINIDHIGRVEMTDMAGDGRMMDYEDYGDYSLL